MNTIIRYKYVALSYTFLFICLLNISLAQSSKQNILSINDIVKISTMNNLMADQYLYQKGFANVENDNNYPHIRKYQNRDSANPNQFINYVYMNRTQVSGKDSIVTIELGMYNNIYFNSLKSEINKYKYTQIGKYQEHNGSEIKKYSNNILDIYFVDNSGVYNKDYNSRYEIKFSKKISNTKFNHLDVNHLLKKDTEETKINTFKKGYFQDERNNIIYRSVKIGNQVWMAENLNTDRFQNGDIIQQAKTMEDWKNAGKNKQPAWCYYNNDIKNGRLYGKLYNYYAVIDSRGLAPSGWHVPLFNEYKVLKLTLGDNFETKLKNTSGWSDFEENGTNSSGWSALPGGARWGHGPFTFEGSIGWWICADKVNDEFDSVFVFEIGYTDGGDFSKSSGFSVRCIQN